MRFVWTVILVLAVLAAIGLVLIYSGAYDVAATHHDPALMLWVIGTTREHSIDARFGKVQRPADLSTSVADGAADYRELCAGCHGGPGENRSAIGAGLYPKPPNLEGPGRDDPEERIYWIIDHGIKMTGMPAFGPSRSDREIWNLAAFIKALPGMTPQEYRRLSGAEGGNGAAGSGAPKATSIPGAGDESEENRP